MPEPERILITGATSQIGGFLCRRLVERGAPVTAVSRTPPPQADGVTWQAADITGPIKLPPAGTLIHLAPLTLLPPLLPAFLAAGGRRVIAFGTTSLYAKATSANAAEQAYATNLRISENRLRQLCDEASVPWTLFRPTLIYGCGRDRNVAVISAIVRRIGVFPLLGPARGLRQPVHADDLAAACVAALDQPATFNRAYDLPGGETLSYREMVERIFQALGKRPRFIRVPMAGFAAAMKLLSLLPRYRDFNVEMASRMNHDLVFDAGPAQRDFAYRPRPFQPPADGSCR